MLKGTDEKLNINCPRRYDLYLVFFFPFGSCKQLAECRGRRCPLVNRSMVIAGTPSF